MRGSPAGGSPSSAWRPVLRSSGWTPATNIKSDTFHHLRRWAHGIDLLRLDPTRVQRLAAKRGRRRGASTSARVRSPASRRRGATADGVLLSRLNLLARRVLVLLWSVWGLRFRRFPLPALPADVGSMAAEIAELRRMLQNRPTIPAGPAQSGEQAFAQRVGSESLARIATVRPGEIDRARPDASVIIIEASRGLSIDPSGAHDRHRDADGVLTRGEGDEQHRGRCRQGSPQHPRGGTDLTTLHHAAPSAGGPTPQVREESPGHGRDGGSLLLLPGAKRLPGAEHRVLGTGLLPPAVPQGEPDSGSAPRDQSPWRLLKAQKAELKRALRATRLQQSELKKSAAVAAGHGGPCRLLYGQPLETAPSPVRNRARKALRSSHSRSRSSSVFRVARSHGHDPWVSKLAQWADDHPGILAARVLQKMSDQLRRDGRRRDWLQEECPPVATSNVHQILRHSFPSMGARNSRELDTLAEVMDRLASGEYARAADLITQRLKAVKMALHDGTWERATHVELLPDTRRLLTSRDEGGAHCERDERADAHPEVHGRRERQWWEAGVAGEVGETRATKRARTRGRRRARAEGTTGERRTTR